MKEVLEESVIYHLGEGDFHAWFKGVLEACVVTEGLTLYWRSSFPRVGGY